MIEVKMNWLKATKGTHVYAAADESSDGAIPTLYVKKGALPTPAPEHITVTIEVGHDD